MGTVPIFPGCPVVASALFRAGFSSEPMTGIEPALSAWEAEVLPLNYIGIRLCAIDSLADQALCGASPGASGLVQDPERVR